MQAIIGGSYNGKRKYVKGFLKNKNISEDRIFFFEGEIPKDEFTKDQYVIIGKLEKIVSRHDYWEEDRTVTIIMNKLLHLDNLTNLICICTDIGRGVVPMKPKERLVRDICGRLYQQIFRHSDTVIRIWYGIPEVLKGEELQ